MEELLEYDIKYDIAKVIENAIGPEKEFCTGYMEPGASKGTGYVTALKMSADTVDMKEMDVLSQIDVAYKRCARNDAYMGQINMSGNTHFIGLNGVLWGYDLARHDSLNGQRPLFLQPQHNAIEIPVYDIKPLLKATEHLFGYANQQRFPLMPGAHVQGANKMAESRGPIWVWSIMSVAIPSNRDEGAIMLSQDAGAFGNENTNESDLIGMLDGILRKITYSIALIGKDQLVTYDRIYIGYKYTFVEPGELGCALACAPNIYLAQNSIPTGMRPAELQDILLSQWENALNLPQIQ